MIMFVVGKVGEWIVVYLDYLSCVEGWIICVIDGGFVV